MPLYPERHIQASAATEDPLSWKGDLLAVGIYSDSLTVKGKACHTRLPVGLSGLHAHLHDDAAYAD